MPVAGLAIGELIVARRVRLAVSHDPDAKLMAAIMIARCVALGKASSLVAAAMIGASTALLIKVIPDASTVTAAANDLRAGVVDPGRVGVAARRRAAAGTGRFNPTRPRSNAVTQL